MQRDKNLVHIDNGQQIDAIQMSYLKTGVSTPDDPVWSRFTQIGPRSDSELASVLTNGWPHPQ